MSLIVLRWSVALVVGAGAASLVVSGSPGMLIALGAAELVAAALFVVPRTTRPAGLALLAVLATAAVLHVSAGQPPPIGFAVDAAAIWVVMAERARARAVAALGMAALGMAALGMAPLGMAPREVAR